MSLDFYTTSSILYIVSRTENDRKGTKMSVKSIERELEDYLTNCGEDAGEWCVWDMAQELAIGHDSIDEIDPDEFTEFLEGWQGKVLDEYGHAVDFEAAMRLADSELCEKVIDEGVDSNQMFFERYAALHLEKYGEEFAPYAHMAW